MSVNRAAAVYGEPGCLLQRAWVLQSRSVGVFVYFLLFNPSPGYASFAVARSRYAPDDPLSRIDDLADWRSFDNLPDAVSDFIARPEEA